MSPWQYWSGSRFGLLALVLLTVIAIAPGNSESRRLRHHEILVAQTATEMLQRNDFLVPHIMGRMRLKKPPLSYWLAIAAHELFGDSASTHVTELEVRLPSLLSGLLLLVVTYQLGLLVTRDARGGLIAAGLTASSWMFYAHVRSGRPEMLYALFCSLLLLGFVMAIRRSEDGLPNRGAAAFAWGAFGLALMAKGPQFPVFFLLGLSLTLVMRRPRPSLSAILHPWMALPALALPVAYFAYLGLQVENVAALWSEELVQGNDIPLLLRPLRFYYPLALLQGFLPWLILFVGMVINVCKRRNPEILLLLNSVLVALLAVSFAGKLRSHYLLPLVPACAVLLAWTLLRMFELARDRASRTRKFWLLVWGQYCLVGILVVAMIATFASQAEDAARDILKPGTVTMLAVAAILYLAAAIAVRRSVAAMFPVLVAAVLFSFGAFSWMDLNESRSAAANYEFVREVEAYLPADAELYSDSSIRVLPYYYYSSNDLQVLSLDEWRNSAAPGSSPYFITLNRDVDGSEIEGQVVLEQSFVDKDKALILFRPAPLSR